MVCSASGPFYFELSALNFELFRFIRVRGLQIHRDVIRYLSPLFTKIS